MLKWIYAAHRAASTAREQFPVEWRQHAALSESFSDITATFARNIQATTVPGSKRLGLDESFDGICLLEITSLRAAREVYAREGISTLLADEARIFAAPTSETCLTALETIIEPGPQGEALIVELVRRLPGQDDRAFFDAWSRQYAERLVNVDGVGSRVRRITHNHVIAPPPAGFAYDGVGELWFDDVIQATRAAEVLSTIPALAAGGFELTARSMLQVSYVWPASPRG